MRKYFFIAIIIIFFSTVFISCSNTSHSENVIIKIGETSYNSLAEAIYCASDGDTILVYNDVLENIDTANKYNFKASEFENKIYVAYEINKPITIKGVKNNSKKPKIYGTFSVDLGVEKYIDNFATIEELEIIHDYVSVTDGFINEPFSVGVKVIEGDANIVDNYIHMSKFIDNETILNNNLPLYYGIMLSRPNNSLLSSESFDYDISGNIFGDYLNNKNDSISSAFIIVENEEDLGTFSPSKINTSSYNYSLSIYNKNVQDNNSLIYACHYDGELNQYKSLITKHRESVNFDKLKLEESRFLFTDNFLSDEIINVDVFGIMVFTGDVSNVVFNLKNKEAIVLINGQKLNNTKINQFEK